jgi:hypothetical protein
MPVTLYVEQWEKLLGFADELRQFMKEHDAELKRKPTREGLGDEKGDEETILL